MQKAVLLGMRGGSEGSVGKSRDNRRTFGNSLVLSSRRRGNPQRSARLDVIAEQRRTPVLVSERATFTPTTSSWGSRREKPLADDMSVHDYVEADMMMGPALDLRSCSGGWPMTCTKS